MTGFFGVWDYTPGQERPWTTKMRDITEALRSIGFDPRQRRKPDIGLLFALAQWGQLRGQLPKKSLRKYLDDGVLFDLLHSYRQVPANAYGFCDLSAKELSNLEKRLNHRWRDVARMIQAMNGPKALLRTANAARRKPKQAVHNPRQSVLSATLKQFNS